MLGGELRTAYPFCCGSRHHSHQPKGPCWLIRMFHPKWGRIQSTVFPWARQQAGRERGPAASVQVNWICAGPWWCPWNVVLGHVAQPKGPGHGRPSQAGQRACQEAEDPDSACGFQQLIIMSKSFFSLRLKWRGWTKMKRISSCLHRSPQGLATQIVVSVCLTPWGFY